MRKRLFAGLLSCIMLLSLLPTSVFAVENGGQATPTKSVSTDASSPVQIRKEVNNEGTKLTLEAYLTNEVTQTVSAKPLDIVLVLDQSGSMAYDFNGNKAKKYSDTRQYAMKQAVNSFIEKAASADGTHNMAVVTFGTDAAVLNNGWTQVNAKGAAALTGAVDGLLDTPKGATNVAAGMEEARKLLAEQTDASRQKVVIVFTDGVPTTTNEFSTTVANSAITAAKAMKDKEAVVYTVGILDGADRNQLYGDKYDRAVIADTPCNGNVGEYWGYTNAKGMFSGGDEKLRTLDIAATNRFLNYLSSNFTTATEIGIKEKTDDGLLGGGQAWEITRNFDRTASNYYLTAKDSASLNEVFQDIIQEISTLKIEAGTNAILSDTLSEYFALNTEGKEAVTAEVQTRTGKDSWEKANPQPPLTISVSGKTIEVNGFDYTKDPVTETKNGSTTTYSGAKLVVTIPIKPDTAYAKWTAGSNLYPTNTEAKLDGCKDKETGAAVPATVLPDSPDAWVTAYSVSYDWNMPEGVTAPSTGLPDTKYYIKGQGYTVDPRTYQDVLSDNGSTLCHFVGWTLDNTHPTDVRGTNQTMGEQDVKLYAMWNPEAAYTVVFNANGGSWKTAPEGYTMGEGNKTATQAGLVAGTKVTAPAEPENGSKVFKGWGFTKNAAEKDAVSGLDGEGTDIKTLRENAEVQNDTVTLYAIWGEAGTEPKQEATVTFRIVGGTWENGTATDITKTFTLTNSQYTLTDADIPTGQPDNAHTKPGIWTDASDEPVTFSSSVVIKEDATFTLTFKGKEIEPPEWDLDVSKSKTATNLDKNYESRVTLSLPSAESKLGSDIVFVLDVAAESKNETGNTAQLMELLKDLKENFGDSNIKVGWLVIGGTDPVYATQELTLLKDIDLDTAMPDLSEKIKEKPYTKGSNLDAGILVGENMLDADDTVDAANKHLVVMSDCGAFTWYDEAKELAVGKYSFYTDSANVLLWGSQQDYEARYNYRGNSNKYDTVEGATTAFADVMNANLEDIDAYSTAANPVIMEHFVTKYDVYTNCFHLTGDFDEDAAVKELGVTGKTGNIPYYDGYDYTSREAALYHAAKDIQAVSKKYDVTLVATAYKHNAQYVESQPALYAIAEAFKNWVSENTDVKVYRVNGTVGDNQYMDSDGVVVTPLSDVFENFKSAILYAVGAGSTVTDTIGDKFTFGGVDSFVLTVGGSKITGAKDDSNANTVNFGEVKNDGTYPYTITYTPANKTFAWTINNNVSNFAPVQLTYTVRLTNPETAAGTYGVTDLNGDSIIDGTTRDTYRDDAALYTNESAVLKPMDSVGNEGTSQAFPKPSVSYTVSGGDHGGGDDDDEDTYYFAIKKVDAQDSHTLNGAKFGLYLDGKQIATATSSRSGIAMFRVYESDYRKITTKSDLYYQELTAPEGYVVSSDKVGIEKSALTTSQTTAEKKAETVRNHRSSTPDLLNDDDHFIGYKNGYVRPYGLISRAETTTIFFRLLKDSVRDGNLLTSNTYTDVPDNYWANTAISTMTGLGIVQGRSSTTFDPQAPITRAQFAAICARFDTGTSSGTQTFSDISGHWAEKYIERAAELGWIKGFEDGTFRPDTYITRAQAMTMINRVLNRIPEENSDLLSNMNVWPDCAPGDWFYLAVQEATNSHDFQHKAGNYEKWTAMNKDPNWTRYEN